MSPFSRRVFPEARGCLNRLQKVVNAPHHGLETVSVAMHTGQLGFRIQRLPLPGHHQLTRHASYVCDGVVDDIQLRILSVKKTIWRCSEKSSPLRLLGIFLKSHLSRTEDMLGKLSPVYETRRTFVRAQYRAPVLDRCGKSSESW